MRKWQWNKNSLKYFEKLKCVYESGLNKVNFSRDSFSLFCNRKETLAVFSFVFIRRSSFFVHNISTAFFIAFVWYETWYSYLFELNLDFFKSSFQFQCLRFSPKNEDFLSISDIRTYWNGWRLSVLPDRCLNRLDQ